MTRHVLALALATAVLAFPRCAHAGNPFGIDHKVAYDDSGLWARKYQKDLAYGAAIATVGGALFVPGDTRLGRTFDQSMDAMAFTAATTTVMKFAFSRERPRENSDPGDFFDHHGFQSFPSGEVAEISAVVTPFIAEYGQDHPAAWGLAALPVYDAIARVKVNAHWQSDVVVGAAVGVGFGLWAHRRSTPLLLGALPGRGLMLGYARRF